MDTPDKGHPHFLMLLTTLAIILLILVGSSGCAVVKWHEFGSMTLLKDISADVTLPDGTKVKVTSNTDEAAMGVLVESATRGAVAGAVRP